MPNPRFAKPVRLPSKQDAIQATITKAAGEAVLAYLRPIVKENPQRLVKTLTVPDLQGAANAAIEAYITARRTEEALEDLLDDPLPQFITG